MGLPFAGDFLTGLDGSGWSSEVSEIERALLDIFFFAGEGMAIFVAVFFAEGLDVGD